MKKLSRIIKSLIIIKLIKKLTPTPRPILKTTRKRIQKLIQVQKQTQRVILKRTQKLKIRPKKKITIRIKNLFQKYAVLINLVKLKSLIKLLTDVMSVKITALNLFMLKKEIMSINLLMKWKYMIIS